MPKELQKVDQKVIGKLCNVGNFAKMDDGK
jgi:hypothetical protein